MTIARAVAAALAAAMLHLAVAAAAAWLVLGHGFRPEAFVIAWPHALGVALTTLALLPLAAWSGARGLAIGTAAATTWVAALAVAVAIRGPLYVPPFGEGALGQVVSRLGRGTVLDVDVLWRDGLLVTATVALVWGIRARALREPEQGPLRTLIARIPRIPRVVIGDQTGLRLRAAVALGSGLALTVALAVVSYLFTADGGFYGAPFDMGRRGSGPSVFGVGPNPTTFFPVGFLADLVVSSAALFLLGRWNGASGVAAAAIGSGVFLHVLLTLLDWTPGAPLAPHGDFAGIPFAVVDPPFAPYRGLLWLDCLAWGTLAASIWRRLASLPAPPARQRLRTAVAVVGALLFQVVLSLATLLMPKADGSFGAPLSVGVTSFGLFMDSRPVVLDPAALLVNVAITALVFGFLARWVGSYGGLLAAAGAVLVPGSLLLSGSGLLPVPPRSAVMPAVIWYDMLFGAILVCGLWVGASRLATWYRRSLALAETGPGDI